jgi:biopolymer transport protein ExbD
MAEIISPSHAKHNKAGVQKTKKLSTRVDLTPMVDLGFLLITFFIFTTSISQPNALSLVLPAEGTGTTTPESKTLNLVLLADNKIHYYVGNEVGKQNCTDFSTEGVRRIIYEMQQRVEQKFGDKAQLVVLIRPTESACYMNIVDILDEMIILDVKKYALMDEEDKQTVPTSMLQDPC